MEFDDIDLSQYKLFYLVCQNGSFSKTANLLGQTQPSVSYGIKKLEETLGVKLFERGSVLTLTPEAEALLPYIEESMSTIKNGVSKVNDIVNLKKGIISVGVPSHIGVILMIDIIKKFNKKYPNIKIRVTCKPTKELFRLLKLNEVDVVIDCSPLEEKINDLEIVKISTEKCYLACNKHRSELLNKKIDLNTVCNYPLIVPARTSSSTKSLKKVFEDKGITFDPSFEIYTSEMIAQMVEDDLGIGFLFEKTINRYPNIEKIDIEEKLPNYDIFMIYKDYLLPITVHTFIEFIKEVSKSNKKANI